MAHHFDVLKAPQTERPAGETAAAVASERYANGQHGLQDELAKLVQRTFVLPGPARTPGAVAICGVEQGVGCSWICAHAGESLAAQVAGRVCIVDGNLRGPSLHKYFSMGASGGLIDAMKEHRPITNFARQTDKQNLWVLTAGEPGNGQNGSLNPASLHARFSELRTQFDYLLIDTPPMSESSDGMLLAQAADGAILVVGSHSTRREAARAAKESFDAAKVSVLGVVLNKRTYPIPEGLYRRI
ncbi:MAG: CpsD/CapB family tyrosine-protein kinase [Candidatus Acidiferrales bacterium]